MQDRASFAYRWGPAGFSHTVTIKQIHKCVTLFDLYLCSGQDALVVTGTFKQMKVKLGEEGFNPAVIKDPLFFLEDGEGYVPMTQDIYNSIAEGRNRLWMTDDQIAHWIGSNSTLDWIK